MQAQDRAIGSEKARIVRVGPTIWHWQLLTLFAFGFTWEFVARNGYIDPLFIGTPSKILKFGYVELFVTGKLVEDMLWTIAGTAISFVLGSVAGIATGLLFVSVPTAERFCEPFLSAMNALPKSRSRHYFCSGSGSGLDRKSHLDSA